jgi:tetratricopeptide (TPR) repeat protein
MKSKLKKGDLFELISKLSKAEKRYFRLSQNKLGKGSKDYMKLFDFLLTQSKHDEQSLKTHFENESFAQRLPAVKMYLYQSILKSLRPLSREVTVVQRVQNLIIDTDFLYKKGLYDQCIILLSRAKRMADEHEINFLRLQILRIQRQYAVEHYKEMKLFSPIDIREEELRILKQMEMINVNEGLANALHNMLFKEGSIRTIQEIGEIKRIHKEAKRIEASSRIAFRSAFLNLYLNGDTNFVLGDYDLAIEYGMKQIQIWEDNPQQLEKNPTDYIKSFNTLFQRALRCGQDEVFLSNIARLEQFMDKIKVQKSIPYEVLGFIRISSNYLYYFTKTGQFDKAIEYYHSIDSQMTYYLDFMEEGTLIEQRFLIAYAYFGNGDYQEAKKWLNRILNDKISLKTDLQVVCRVFEIVIYLFQNDFDMVENRIPRVYRFLENLNRLYPFENSILSCIQNIVADNVYMEKNSKKELSVLKKGTISYSAFDYFNIHACLKAYIENKTITEIIEED